VRVVLRIFGGTNLLTTREISPLYLGAAVSPRNQNPPFPPFELVNQSTSMEKAGAS
jgi:hypothetical protein